MRQIIDTRLQSLQTMQLFRCYAPAFPQRALDYLPVWQRPAPDLVDPPAGDASSNRMTAARLCFIHPHRCRFDVWRQKDKPMDWVLFVSLQWIVYGSPTQPTTQQIQSFQTEELCAKAAEAIRTEINAPIASGRVQTVGRVVCVLRKVK